MTSHVVSLVRSFVLDSYWLPKNYYNMTVNADQDYYTESFGSGDPSSPNRKSTNSSNARSRDYQHSSAATRNDHANRGVGGGTTKQIGGAAVLGGITGLVLGGPITAVVVASGVALCAATPGSGPVRDVSRATGDVVATTGQQLHQWDQKHGVSRKTSKTIVKGCQWMNHKISPNKTPANNHP
jgi:hypothetical protein